MESLFIFLFIFVPIGLIFYRGYLYASKSNFNFKDELFLFAAIILKVDNNPSKQEIDYVNSFLIREFGKRKAYKYLTIIKRLIQSHNEQKIPNALKRINYEQDNYTKIQFLSFLVKITIIDKYLSKSEYNALVKICNGIGLLTIQLNSILAMYNYVSEAD